MGRVFLKRELRGWWGEDSGGGGEGGEGGRWGEEAEEEEEEGGPEWRLKKGEEGLRL